MKAIALLLFAVGLTSCSTIRVNYDYDRDTDFAAYRTYQYYSDMDTGLSELDTKRLLDVLDMALRAKGLRFSEEPDFFIDITSTTFQASNNNVGVGVGGTGGNIGGGVSVGLPVGGRKIVREIQFEFIASQKDMLIWQAVGKGSFNEDASPVEREQNLRNMVEKVLSEYPPK